MAFSTFILLATAFAVFQPCMISGQRTSTTSQPMTTSAEWIDPNMAGKSGSPGARIHLSNKTIADVHSYLAKLIVVAVEYTDMSDFSINSNGGQLIIKPPRISQIKIGSTEHQLLPPNRVSSRFVNVQLSGKGMWEWKRSNNWVTRGMYQATITKGELNGTTQFGRTADGKPTAQIVECKANLDQHRVEIQGSPDIKLTIENCNVETSCVKVRNYFEDVLCTVLKTMVKDFVNAELQNFPTKVATRSENYKTDYSLLANEPKITFNGIQAGLEGKYIWRGSSYVPFNPSPLNWTDNQRMFSFVLSDYTFNTLMHQAHSAGYKFSAFKLASQSVQQLLRLNCSDQAFILTTPSTRKVHRYGKPAKSAVRQLQKYQCLGQLFENFTSFGPYSANDTGDIVYRSGLKAKSIFVESDKSAFFDGSDGTLEILGPATGSNNRQSLAKADVSLLRGDFLPKLNGFNITGSIKINQFRLAQQPSQNRMINDQWLDKLAQFSTQIVSDSINAFFNNYAQFSPPLPESYVCDKPELTVSARTMQVDCDVNKGEKLVIVG